jgi:DMSO reductase anchor subunit
VHPAFSVIFLTTLIGAGQGLFLALYGIEITGLPLTGARSFYTVGSLIALGLLIAGLIASFFHLGHPERAWRTATMWRTSWLSREVIVLPAFMALVTAYGAAHHFNLDGTLLIGIGGVVLCLALFVCTAMIYACLKFLQEWHTPLTIVNYILLGCASGFTLSAAYAALMEPSAARPLAVWAMIFTLAGLITRCASLARNARLKPKSNLQSAIGIAHPRIVQKAQGFMGGSFNTREFFHGRAATALRMVKWAFLMLAFVIPLALLATGMTSASAGLLTAAFVAQYLGLIAERWFFFAQANHPQNLYFQTIS